MATSLFDADIFQDQNPLQSGPLLPPEQPDDVISWNPPRAKNTGSGPYANANKLQNNAGYIAAMQQRNPPQPDTKHVTTPGRSRNRISAMQLKSEAERAAFFADANANRQKRYQSTADKLAKRKKELEKGKRRISETMGADGQVARRDIAGQYGSGYATFGGSKPQVAQPPAPSSSAGAAGQTGARGAMASASPAPARTAGQPVKRPMGQSNMLPAAPESPAAMKSQPPSARGFVPQINPNDFGGNTPSTFPKPGGPQLPAADVGQSPVRGNFGEMSGKLRAPGIAGLWGRQFNNRLLKTKMTSSAPGKDGAPSWKDLNAAVDESVKRKKRIRNWSDELGL